MSPYFHGTSCIVKEQRHRESTTDSSWPSLRGQKISGPRVVVIFLCLPRTDTGSASPSR